MIRAPWLLMFPVLLGACEAQIGTDETRRAPVEVAGKAEAGTVSIDTPGFDLKLKIPDVVRAQIGTDGDLVYPGATLGGVHVAADGQSGGNGSVELRFTTPDAIERVAAWYRDPARAAELAVANVVREQTGLTISGTQTGDGDPFTVRLAPAAGGGTEARLVLRDRQG
jgi:hypothetical protein